MYIKTFTPLQKWRSMNKTFKQIINRNKSVQKTLFALEMQNASTTTTTRRDEQGAKYALNAKSARGMLAKIKRRKIENGALNI